MFPRNNSLTFWPALRGLEAPCATAAASVFIMQQVGRLEGAAGEMHLPEGGRGAALSSARPRTPAHARARRDTSRHVRARGVACALYHECASAPGMLLSELEMRRVSCRELGLEIPKRQLWPPNNGDTLLQCLAEVNSGKASERCDCRSTNDQR
ncbi:Protein of unknown function [Gryllus bimaculatus]|nr:Protein of unknown function [Gryllus bimaculatus]